MRIIYFFFCFLLLSGCVSRHKSPAQFYFPQTATGTSAPVTTGKDEGKIENIQICKEYQVDTAGNSSCATTLESYSTYEKDVVDFNRLYVEALRSKNDPARVGRYLDQGLLVNAVTCRQYLSDLNAAQKRLEFGRDQSLLIGLLASGALAMSNNNNETLQGISMGSSFLSDSSQLFRDTFLLGPAPRAVSELVIKKMDAFRAAALQRIKTIDEQDGVLEFTEAHHQLSTQAGICSESGITYAIQEVVVRADFVPEGRDGLVSTKTSALLQNIRKDQSVGLVATTLSKLPSPYLGAITPNEAAIVCGAVFDRKFSDSIKDSTLGASFKGLFTGSSSRLAQNVNQLMSDCRYEGHDEAEIVKEAAQALTAYAPKELEKGDDPTFAVTRAEFQANLEEVIAQQNTNQGESQSLTEPIKLRAVLD